MEGPKKMSEGMKRCSCTKDDAPFQFQVGDIVSFGGCEGTVTEINTVDPSYPYPIRCNFLVSEMTFMLDGKVSLWHTEPLLKFIRRPKKKVKKTRDVWINVFPDFEGIYRSKEEADKTCWIHQRIACTKVTLEWEEEE